MLELVPAWSVNYILIDYFNIADGDFHIFACVRFIKLKYRNFWSHNYINISIISYQIDLESYEYENLIKTIPLCQSTI